MLDENDNELTADDRRAIAESRKCFRNNPEGGIPSSRWSANAVSQWIRLRRAGLILGEESNFGQMSDLSSARSTRRQRSIFCTPSIVMPKPARVLSNCSGVNLKGCSADARANTESSLKKLKTLLQFIAFAGGKMRTGDRHCLLMAISRLRTATPP